jgi:hypothetical protein
MEMLAARFVSPPTFGVSTALSIDRRTASTSHDLPFHSIVLTSIESRHKDIGTIGLLEEMINLAQRKAFRQHIYALVF